MAWQDDYEPLPGVPVREPRYDHTPWLPPPQPPPVVDPIWPTSNPVGTERFVDYRGWDRPYYPPQPAQDPVQQFIAPAPNTQYGSVLPIARDTQTGESRWAMPSAAREFIQGRYDLTQGPRTGTVTPEATMSMGGSALRTSMGGGGSEALRTFGGVRSQTADMQMQGHAQRAWDKGVSAEDIWTNTGWWRTRDGKWKYEISDDTMGFHPQPALISPSGVPLYGYPPADTTYGQLVRHPEIQQAYPMLNNMEVKFGQLPPDAAAAYRGSTGPGDPGGLYFGNNMPFHTELSHETQHAIQRQEGWAPGGMNRVPQMVKDPTLAPYFKQELGFVVNELLTPISFDEFAKRRGPFITGEDPKALYQKYLAAVPPTIVPGSQLHRDVLQKAADNVYDRFAGEVEARLVEKRLGMSPDERIQRPPWMDWDVPAKWQIHLPPHPIP